MGNPQNLRLLFSIAPCLLLHMVFLNEVSCNSEAENVHFDRDLFAVAYSPYVKNYVKVKINGTDEEEAPSRNSYNYNDHIMTQVELAATKFGTLVPFSMGTKNATHPWPKSEAIGLTTLAAGTANHNADKLIIKVIQGVYQNNDTRVEKNELRNAFVAADYANQLYNGTVTGISFFSFTNMTKEAEDKILYAYQIYRTKARQFNLKRGTRFHNCDEILDPRNPFSENMKNVAKRSDFVLCSIIPTYEEIHQGPKHAVEEIGKRFTESRKILLKVNPNITVYNGETGWPSEGSSYNGGDENTNTVNNSVLFWTEMNKWAIKNNIPVILYSAFDEPWRSDPKIKDPAEPSGRFGVEGHYGWFTYKGQGDNGTYIEKYLDPDQYRMESSARSDSLDIDKLDDNYDHDYHYSTSNTATITTICVVLAILLMIGQGIMTLYKQIQSKRQEDTVNLQDAHTFFKEFAQEQKNTMREKELEETAKVIGSTSKSDATNAFEIQESKL